MHSFGERILQLASNDANIFINISITFIKGIAIVYAKLPLLILTYVYIFCNNKAMTTEATAYHG